ncbi:MAG: antitoxin [Anaerolineae bacterium]|nr:antitoxin [Anaerolineae bacterium]
MYKELRISETLYEALEIEARRRGLDSIEQLLEVWKQDDAERRSRRAIVREIDALRSELQHRYGEMPDSTPLVREDRDSIL